MKSKVIEVKALIDTFSHSSRVIRYRSIERSDFGMILMSFNNPLMKEKFLSYWAGAHNK